MGFHVIPPPSQVQTLMSQGKTVSEAVDICGSNMAEVGKPIWTAAQKLGMSLDVPGFLYSWLSGTRVLVEKDDKDNIVTLAFMTVGRKWTVDDSSATILELQGKSPEDMLEFAKQIAAALGARVLYHEDHINVREDEVLEHIVLEYRIG